MQKITKINALQKLDKKLRVAAYCRVSCDKDAMLQSLSSQVSYYNQLIQSNKEWQFVKVYSDEALTGTKDERPAFQELLEDCRKGMIDLVLVKAVSRFARNTLTMLETVRELRALNVDVYFEEEGIHSISPEGEMILTMVSTFAQEEARSVSENMKVRIKHDFEEGIIWGSKNCVGYRLIDKKLILVPEEAKLVRSIYQLYLDGYGVVGIAKILNHENVKTLLGGRWCKSTIQNIITNYNYTGDLLLQKTYRLDFLTKKTRRNKGEYNQYLVENDHDSIISKEMFFKVQEERIKRTSKYKLNHQSSNNTYPLTGMIKCDCCGKYYRHKKNQYNELWICQTFDQFGKDYCSAKQVPQKALDDAIEEVLGIKEYDKEKLETKIDYILAKNGNVLIFYFKDGTTKEIRWKNPSRGESWTPEMKELARQRAIAQNQKKGADGRWQKS